MKTNRILELDGLRAFAVGAVIIFHMWGWAGAIPNTNPLLNSFISCYASSGVYVFFIISGFTITSLFLREKEKTGDVSLTAFYIRRFVRLMPPLIGYILGLALLTQVGYLSIKPINYVWALLFLGNLGLFEGTGHNFLAHTWSLAVQEQYYFILPPIMIIGMKLRVKPINILLIFLFFFSLASLKIANELSKHVFSGFVSLSSIFKFRYIIIGIAIALHRKTIQKLLANTSILLPVLLLALLYGSHVWKSPPLVNLILDALETVWWGLFVMWLVENPEKCGLLRWRVVQWLGTCSYSIFLWQQLFTNPASCYNGWSIAQSPLAIVPILILATLSYYLIEKPSIQAAHYLSAKVLAKRGTSNQTDQIRHGETIKI